MKTIQLFIEWKVSPKKTLQAKIASRGRGDFSQSFRFFVVGDGGGGETIQLFIEWKVFPSRERGDYVEC